MGDVTFLTPLDGCFALFAAIPLVALLVTERRSSVVRRLLALRPPRRRAVVPVAVALLLLTSLVAVAAAQPVVIRQRLVSERADAQAYFLFDTSLSMRASAAAGQPDRLTRAKHIALRIRAALPDVPVGIASMTDRSLPNVLPTTDEALFTRVLNLSVGVNRPPPSQTYPGRATTFQALVPLGDSHFYAQGVQRRLLIVFTDGESAKLSPLFALTYHRQVTTIFVHVWAPGERIHRAGGKIDRKYVSDPGSAAALDHLAVITGTRHAFPEDEVGALIRAARDTVGYSSSRTHVAAYARVALAPWFALGGIAPLAFLLWRRNL